MDGILKGLRVVEGSAFVAAPRGWLAYESLRQNRADLIHINTLGDRHGGYEVDYTVNPLIGFPTLPGPANASEPVNHVLPAWDHICGQMAAVAAVKRSVRCCNLGSCHGMPQPSARCLRLPASATDPTRRPSNCSRATWRPRPEPAVHGARAARHRPLPDARLAVVFLGRRASGRRPLSGH